MLAIFEGIDEPVYVADFQTYELLFVNRAATKLFGPVQGRRCYEYLQHRSAPCPFCTNEKILGEYLGRSYVWEFQNEATGHWFKCVDKAIRWPDGRLVRYEMAIDITDRKLAEDAAREQEDRLRALSDNLPGGVVYQFESSDDGSHRQITYVSAGVEALHEVTMEEVLTEPERLWGQVHEDDRAFMEERRRESARTGSPLNVEVRVQLPSGKTGWRSLSSAPRRLPDGRLVWDGIVMDITDRKRAEELVREDDERLRSLSDNLPGGMVCRYESAADGSHRRATYFSAGLGELHELSMEEALAAPERLWDQVHPEDRPGLEQCWTESARTLRPFSTEVRVRLPSGREGWHYVASAPRRLADGRLVWDGVDLDITDRKLAEEATRESEERLRTLADNLPGGLVFQAELLPGTDKRRYLYVSAGLEALHELTMEDFKAGRVDNILLEQASEEDARLWRQSVGAALETMTPVNREILIRLPSGKTRWSHLVASPRRTPDGRILLEGIELDISERKLAEEATRDSEERLRSLSDNLPGGLVFQYCTDAHGRKVRVVHVSAGVAALHEASAEDVLTGRVDILSSQVSKEDRLRWTQGHLAAAESMTPMTFEVQFRLPSGRTRWAYMTSAPRRLPDGRVLWDGLELDITARKLAEEAIRESQERLRALSDSLPGGMVYQLETTPEGGARRFTYVSAGVQAMHELTAEEVLADPMALYSQVHKEDRPEFELLEREAVESGKPFLAEARLVLPSGRTVWHLLASAPRPMPDGRVLWDGVELDITDRKRAEEEQTRLREQLNQAQKMEAVGRLAGGIAHDFNNMLAVIIGQAELAMDGIPESDPMAADLQNIRAAAERSAELTRQLLAFARKQTILPKILDMNRTIGGMLQMLRRLIGENIELSWVPGSDVGLVRMDPSQIDQILVNLCLNARDAIGAQGRILIETSNADLGDDYRVTYAGYLPGSYVMLAVSDDGSGMDAETMAHAFEPFFTTKEKGKGTGLGLATVYGIVRQNEGFVNVYSEPGHGTIFKIYIPRCAEGWAPTPKAPIIPAEGGHESILLVEDEQMLREIIQEMLQRCGYTVMSAATPEEAIRLAREHESEIHLVLTDVVMPQMSGCELVSKVQPFHPEARRLFMSGYTASLVARHGVQDFDLHYIQKPFSMHDLAFKIRQALAGFPA